jgi:hypothetical protein
MLNLKLFDLLIVHILTAFDLSVVRFFWCGAVRSSLLVLPHVLTGSTNFEEKAAQLVEQVDDNGQYDEILHVKSVTGRQI